MKYNISAIKFSGLDYYGVHKNLSEMIEGDYSGRIKLHSGITKIRDHCFRNTDRSYSLEIPKSVKYMGKYLFNDPILNGTIDIYYEGTKSEWNLIEKHKYWKFGVSVKITCSDGVIS